MLTDPERDRDCVKRILSGDTAALGELYDRYTPLLYPMALRILGTGAEAEDAVQDAWVQVWSRAASYDPRRGSVGAWLVTLARSRAIDRYRGVAARGRAEAKAEPPPAAGPDDPAVDAARVQLGDRVRQALERLEPKQREVLEIAYFQGLTQTEIADRLNAPLGTVKSWTRQGLMRLREMLPQEEWA